MLSTNKKLTANTSDLYKAALIGYPVINWIVMCVKYIEYVSRLRGKNLFHEKNVLRGPKNKLHKIFKRNL